CQIALALLPDIGCESIALPDDEIRQGNLVPAKGIPWVIRGSRSNRAERTPYILDANLSVKTLIGGAAGGYSAVRKPVVQCDVDMVSVRACRWKSVATVPALRKARAGSEIAC